jgi:hypothetical protein
LNLAMLIDGARQIVEVPHSYDSTSTLLVPQVLDLVIIGHLPGRRRASDRDGHLLRALNETYGIARVRHHDIRLANASEQLIAW